MKFKSGRIAVVAVALAAMAAAVPATAVEISFYYPVAVSGPLTKIIDGLAADFEKANPDIKVKPVYSGNYGETLAKALTANKSGQPPQVAVLVASDSLTVIDEDAVVPMEGFVKTPSDRAWLDGFFPAFLMNGRYEGKTYGIPFQRSTQVLYWNKAAFREAGLDPNHPPANWDEMVEMGKKLTVKDAAGNVTRWGLIIPSGVTSHWFLQGFTTQNRAKLTNEAGTETYLATPEAVESLQYWVDLSRKHKIMQEGIIDTGHGAERIHRRTRCDDVPFHRQPGQREEQREVRLWRGHAPRAQAARVGDGRRQHLHFQEEHAGATGRELQVRQVVDECGAVGALEHRNRLRGAAPGRVGPAGDEAVREGLPARSGRARTVAVLRAGVLHARWSAHDQGTRGRDRGVDHRHQDAGQGACRRPG